MFTKHFTLSETRTTLGRIVKRHGKGHVAQSQNGGVGCVYAQVIDNVLTPVCIVGQFFADYGLLGLLMNDAPDLSYTGEPDQFGSCGNNNMWETLADHGITFDKDAQEYLRAAQNSQDRGSTWGTALVFADDFALWQAQEPTRIALGLGTTLSPDRYDAKYINLDNGGASE